MKTSIIISCLLLLQTAQGQIPKSGFDKFEYTETLKINRRTHILLDKWDEIKTVPDRQIEFAKMTIGFLVPNTKSGWHKINCLLDRVLLYAQFFRSWKQPTHRLLSSFVQSNVESRV